MLSTDEERVPLTDEERLRRLTFLFIDAEHKLGLWRPPQPLEDRTKLPFVERACEIVKHASGNRKLEPQVFEFFWNARTWGQDTSAA
jgi:hypothetical protein